MSLDIQVMPHKWPLNLQTNHSSTNILQVPAAESTGFRIILPDKWTTYWGIVADGLIINTWCQFKVFGCAFWWIGIWLLSDHQKNNFQRRHFLLERQLLLRPRQQRTRNDCKKYWSIPTAWPRADQGVNVPCSMLHARLSFRCCVGYFLR